jgi:hypothetical protein
MSYCTRFLDAIHIMKTNSFVRLSAYSRMLFTCLMMLSTCSIWRCYPHVISWYLPLCILMLSHCFMILSSNSKYDTSLILHDVVRVVQNVIHQYIHDAIISSIILSCCSLLLFSCCIVQVIWSIMPVFELLHGAIPSIHDGVQNLQMFFCRSLD